MPSIIAGSAATLWAVNGQAIGLWPIEEIANADAHLGAAARRNLHPIGIGATPERVEHVAVIRLVA